MPHAPEIALHVADEATELWQKTEEELGEIGLPPPFWAFAWAGGQALARYVLDHPETVRGQARARFRLRLGPRRHRRHEGRARAEVTACDIDAFAIAAIGLNAAANGVSVTALAGETSSARIAAGIRCSQATSATSGPRRPGRRVAVLPCSERGATVLIGDPGRSYLPKDRLDSLAVYQVPVTRTLEDSDIKKSSVWRFRNP